tara:strand:+ start:700 stop:879 length:180 start_codon:yes stop_codon:yes gene_type:complete
MIRKKRHRKKGSNVMIPHEIQTLPGWKKHLPVNPRKKLKIRAKLKNIRPNDTVRDINPT